MIRRIALAAVLVAGLLGAFVALGATEEGDLGKSYRVEFDNAFGLTEGGDLRVGGVRAGETTGFSVSDGEPARAIVDFRITEPGFETLKEDAFCSVRQQSLIGEYYVDCQPGDSEEELAEGATIPVEQTASIVPADLVNDVLRLPYKERLRLILAELGTGLAGRPRDLAETIRRAHPGLRETTKTLQVLGEQKRIIQNFVQDSDAVVAELARNRVDVARFVREARDAAQISASEDEALAAGFQKLPGFLEQLEPYMVSLGRAADEQIPLLADLRRAAPDLNRFFTELGPFANASRPAIRTLGDASVVGERALNESADEIRTLRKLAGKAPKLATPLRQFLVSLDDRGRAVERDPRAAQTAPPAPDPTSKNPIRGFTGMEAFLNYAYWQTLAINGFDDVSHFLRILGVAEPTVCSSYNVDPDRRQIERCNTYLGPFQPGIKNATGVINGHDFGDAESGNIPKDGAGTATTSSRKGGGRGADARGGRGGGGGRDTGGVTEREAGPGGGPQPGLSEPRVVVPPQVDDTVGGVTERLNPRREPSEKPERSPSDGSREDEGGSAPSQLLDFLLGP